MDIYRYLKFGTLSWTSMLSGSLQVLLYADFLYLYLNNMKSKLLLDLPILSSGAEKAAEKHIF